MCVTYLLDKPSGHFKPIKTLSPVLVRRIRDGKDVTGIKLIGQQVVDYLPWSDPRK
jgi:hypothetical protein